MDMTGMKTINAKQLTEGDIISFEKWTDDLKVLEVLSNNEIVKIKTIGVCSDIHGEEEKTYEPNEQIVIVKR